MELQVGSSAAASSSAGAGHSRAGPAPSMRDLVRALVRAELLAGSGDAVAAAARAPPGSGGLAADLFREASTRSFLQVFQRLSVSPAPRRGADLAGAEAAVSDLIAAHLLRSRRKDARGLDRHLRFHGLRKRMQTQPVLRSAALRTAVLELLHCLRGAADGDAAGDAAGDIGAPTAKALDAFPMPSKAAALQLQAPPPSKDAGTKKAAPQCPVRLGWHVPGASGGPPVPISEQHLLRDLLHALQGVDSACFKFRKAEGVFVVDAAYALSRPAWYLVQRILELGNLHMRLCGATAAALEAEAGRSLLQQALCEALRDQLRDYYKVLALLMAKVDPSDVEPASPELTLRRLWTWLQAPLERMRLLATLSEACAPLRGGALASAVHGFSRVGDAQAQDACAAILRRVLAPLLAAMRAWMTEGELQDPFGEFFVCADASVPLEDLWTRMYFLDIEMVPSFMPLELARKILLTGKSVNFIRLCCHGQEWLPPAGGGGVESARGHLAGVPPSPRQPRPASGVPLRRTGTAASASGAAPSAWAASPLGGTMRLGAQPSPALAMPGDPRGREDVPGLSGAAEADGSSRRESPLSDLSKRVEQAALQTNQHLVALMMGRYALGEHCLAFRRFLLLGQGDFVESLLDTVGPELSRPASEVYRHQLQGILDMAVRQTNAQFCPQEVLARLGVKLLQPSAGEKAWDIFLLDYAIDSPLHVVFTPTALQQYDRAFAFLWKLRRVSHALAACWGQQMALQRHLTSRSGGGLRGATAGGARAPELRLEMRQTLHKCTCLRNELHHFVQNIHSYIMCEVLETSWAKLQQGWQDCVDLDQVILEHQRYLSCIEEGAFLAPRTEPILTALTALLGVALEFTELHDQVCASAFEAAEALGAEPGGPAPFARSLAECRAQLDQLGASFLARLQSLLRALEAQPPLRHLTSDLRFLLCRLDFNAFYEQKRERAATPR